MKPIKLPQWNSARRTAIAAIAALALVPLANAGTYSIIGVQWYPSNTPGTGTVNGTGSYSGSYYIHFNNYDVDYGLTCAAGAPYFTANGEGPPVGHTYSNAVTTVLGTWQWVVQWVGAAGEPAPDYITGTAEYLGNSSCTTYLMSFGGSASCLGELNDAFYAVSNGGSAGAPGVPGGNTVYSPNNNIIQNLTVGTTFTYVPGTTNTYIGYFTDDVNDIASCTANGSLGPGGMGPAGEASVSLQMAVATRLCFVAGIRIQPDL